MTVGELINELTRFDESMDVMIFYEENNHITFARSEIKRVYKDSVPRDGAWKHIITVLTEDH
jgi:hypothetical protein